MFKALCVVILAAFIITQIILPIFFKDLRYFNLFRKEIQPDVPIEDLHSLDREVNESTSQLQKTKKKVNKANEAINQMQTKIKNTTQNDN